MTDGELQRSLPLAALDALDGEDVRTFEAHLADCMTCHGELAALREVSGWICVATTPVEPSASLRRRILELREPPPRNVAAGFLPARGFWAAFAAASVLVVVWGVSAYAMHALGLLVRARALEGQLAVQRELADFLSSPDTATIVLAGTDAAPNARLKLAYDRGSGRAVLFGYELPLPPPGKAYQLWFIAGGTPRAGRIFAPDATGRGSWDDNVPPEGRDASVFAVTLEPAGGVAVPSGPMILKSVSLS